MWESLKSKFSINLFLSCFFFRLSASEKSFHIFSLLYQNHWDDISHITKVPCKGSKYHRGVVLLLKNFSKIRTSTKYTENTNLCLMNVL